MPRFGTSPACRPWLLAALALSLSGCRLALRSLAETPSGVEVALDSNRRSVAPGFEPKFFVDLTNRTGWSLDLSDLSVELTASPAGTPGTVALRKTWTYRWPAPLRLAPGRRVTVPLRPETAKRWSPELSQPVVISEFPLTQLAPGEYDIRATVMERLVSPPYRLRVERPDLRDVPEPQGWGR